MARGVQLREKTISWALYHHANNEYLRETLEEATGEPVEHLQAVCRELPLMCEAKQDFTLAGYATGWRLHKTDLLATGEVGGQPAIFPIEVKVKASRSAYQQVMKYAAGLVVTANRDAHNVRGGFYRWLMLEIFRHKGQSEILGMLSSGREIRVVPTVLYERNGRHTVKKGPDYRFTQGLKDLLHAWRIRIQDPVSAKLERTPDIIDRLAAARAEHLESVYPEWESLRAALNRARMEGSVPRFTTTEGGRTWLMVYPGGRIEVEGRSGARRIEDPRLGTPLGILEALDDIERGRFWLQVFLSGLNNPTLYLQAGEDLYLGFQLREPYRVNCDGAYNEYIATDAQPLRGMPEAGDVLSPVHGTHRVENITGMRGFARRLHLEGDDGLLATLTIVSPEVRKARSSNQSRPFLSNSEAVASAQMLRGTQDVLFDYRKGAIKFVSVGPVTLASVRI